MADLLSSDATGSGDEAWVPLAERMRPRTLDEVLGQGHLLGGRRVLRSLVEQRQLRSLLLWGPPGCGKTTIARLYAGSTGAELVQLSAVTSGVRELREVVEAARLRRVREGRPTLLFIDELHRFNKAQQDALLPHVEQGVVTLIGATTENPSFSVTNALRSRCQVLVLEPLTTQELSSLLDRALADAERGLGPTAPSLSEAARDAIVVHAAGDARTALNAIEAAARLAQAEQPGGPVVIEPTHVAEAVQRRMLSYDKDGSNHYMLASAFIKSMRGSDPDAALHYMLRMLEAGEDPRFLLRRMVIFASEDIGNADPEALQVAVSAMQAFELVGMPEGVLPMTQAATYLATAPKSNAVFKAYGKALADIKAHGALPVPKHLVQAVGALLKSMGFGKGYKYPHHYEGGYVVEKYLPDRLRGHVYYEPGDQGREIEIRERLRAWKARASERRP